MYRLGVITVLFCIAPLFNFKIISVKEGTSFVHYIDIQDGELQNCILHVEGQDGQDENITLYPPTNYRIGYGAMNDKMVNMAARTCGFKFNNVRRYDAHDYNLTAVFQQNGETITKYANAIVKIVDPPALRNTTVITSYGASLRVECRATDFCSLRFPNGELAVDGTLCSYPIRNVANQHIGEWECKTNIEGSIEPILTYTDLRIKPRPKIVTWYKEDDGYAYVGCKFMYYDREGHIERCSMIRPDKQIMRITENSANGRYDSFGTDFTENTCQIEFPLPVQENEMGTWECILQYNKGFIDVKRASSYPRYKTITAKLHDSINVPCEVPYAASNCLVLSPTGKLVKIGSYENAQNGICEVSINNLTETDFGNWTCHISKGDSFDDDIITVNFVRLDLVRAKFSHITVDANDEAVILFMANGAISYCALEDPHGKTYHIWPNTNTPMLEYYGKGFSYGDCGIRLKKVDVSHEGTWKCLTRISGYWYSEPEYQGLENRVNIEVVTEQEAAIATASSASILIGIAVAMAIVLILTIYVKYVKDKRRREHASPPNSLGDENSETTFALTSHL